MKEKVNIMILNKNLKKDLMPLKKLIKFLEMLIKDINPNKTKVIGDI
tara:strand:+ start:255 stop:395 length:141 start_codon:yes stop_codon:yes gene_type:complete